MPPFGIRRLPVAHMGLPTLFLCFLYMRLFFGDFPLLLTEFSYFPPSFPDHLSLHAALLFVRCLWLVYCGLLLRMPSLWFVCLARIFPWFSLFLTFIFDSFHIRASLSSLTQRSVIFISCLCLAFPCGTFSFL